MLSTSITWTILPILLHTLTSASPVPASQRKDLILTERNTPLNTLLSIFLAYIPAINESITTATSTITDLDSVLAALTGAQTSYNELDSLLSSSSESLSGSGSSSGSTCTNYTLIFARGTSEPGNVGVLVGPPLIEALEALTSSLTKQGVENYSASVEGYLSGGDSGGSTNMASQISQVYSLCPNTKLIAAGYSQGCQIVHNAIAQVPAQTAAWISSILLFGDPDNGQALSNVDADKVHTVCHDGDDICLNGIFILPAHLTYAEDVASAAALAVS